MSTTWRDVVLMLALTVLLSIAGAVKLTAHDSRPVVIDLVERVGGLYVVQWRTPMTVAFNNVPVVTLTEPCQPVAPATRINDLTDHIYQGQFTCSEGLASSSLTILYPDANPSLSTMIRLEWQSGEVRTFLLGPDETAWQVPPPESWDSVALDYLRLGISHILTGYDHLLFVACLILLAGTWRRILITVTGFTIAHSVTLALSVLRVVTVPVPPVEAAIALSIVFVAWELSRGSSSTLTSRYPIAVSSSFGLLHGFAFASVLQDIGLPQTEIPIALLFFNVGVEIGQLLFVAAFVVLLLAADRIGIRKPTPDSTGRYAHIGALTRPAIYVVGALSVFWFLERVTAF
jgi:hydrogenase/urease accessory protein HupE